MARALNVIDADGHITEPADLWETYIDPRFRADCPKIFFEPGGVERFRVDDQLSFSTEVRPLKTSIASSTAFGLRDGAVDWDRSYLEGEKGGFDPHERIKWMDAEGFDGTVLFPTMALIAIWEQRDPRRIAAVTDAYNRFVVDFCAPYPDRLFGAACLPMASVEDAIRQVRTARKAGMRVACVRPNPVDGKALHHPDFYPVWEACQEEDLAIAVHGTAGRQNLGYDRFASSDLSTQAGVRTRHAVGSYAIEHCFTHTAEMMAAVTSFVLAGVCDRFPRLRVGFIEAGGAWLPGYVDRMDRHFDDAGQNDTGLKTRPSGIFQRQCFTGFEPIETSIKVLAEHFGPSKLMLSTDYPHSDGFPHSLKALKSLNLPADVEADLCSAGMKAWLRLD